MYTGPPELTPSRVLTSWTVDVPVLVVVLRCGLPGPRWWVTRSSAWPCSPTSTSSPARTTRRWPWGPSLRADQVIGGGALWILGDLVGLPFLAAQLIQVIREDEREAAPVDAELDARAEAAARGTGEAGTAPAATPDSQPWWESDPRFTGRFRRPGRR